MSQNTSAKKRIIVVSNPRSSVHLTISDLGKGWDILQFDNANGKISTDVLLTRGELREAARVIIRYLQLKK